MVITIHTKLTPEQIEEHCVSAESLEYWESIADDERTLNWERVNLFETFRGAERLAMAMNASFAHSDISRQRAQDKHDAHQNEELICSRTGNKVPRKHAVVAGNTVVSFDALSDAEREFFRVEEVEAELQEIEQRRSKKSAGLER